MIKINLLPQRKVRRQADPGQQQALAGFGAMLAAGAAVFFLIHKPLADKVAALQTTNENQTADNAAKKSQLKNFEALKKVVAADEERSRSIAQLVRAKSVPAFLLHELGTIMSPGRLPTMTKAMAQRISDGPQGDPNRRFALDWDPKHVWITSFTEKAGVFTLEGGAQSDPDVTQLAKRMQASVYFEEVTPRGGERIADAASGITYYKFTITGKVVY